MRRRSKPLPKWVSKTVLVAVVLLAAVLLAVETQRLEPATADIRIPEGTELTATFIDVGQGDAILISTRGQHILIDAGTAQSGGKVLETLADRGVDRLALVVATHPHADHIGGMAAVLDTFEVGTFIMPEAAHTTKTFENMLDAIERNGCDAQYGAAGQVYRLGAAQIDVLWPQPGPFEGDNLNNSSLVISVRCGETYMLFTGDAEAEVEEVLRHQIAGFDVLKVGHHGSHTSSTADFVRAINPSVAVISCGAGNDYGHPHAETLETLADTAVYRTDLNGTVVVASDGREIHVYTEKALGS